MQMDLFCEEGSQQINRSLNPLHQVLRYRAKITSVLGKADHLDFPQGRSSLSGNTSWPKADFPHKTWYPPPARIPPPK